MAYPDKYITNFEVGGQYNVLIYDESLLDEQFIPYTDIRYTEEKGFIDDDYQFNGNPELLNGGYIFVIKNGKLLISKRENKNGKFIFHSDLAQGDNVDFAGEIQIVFGRIEDFSNGSGHYKPEISGKEKLFPILRSMGYRGTEPIYNNY